ncbi:MAG: class I SAM-dependent methyltransferase [Planctomycetales bacterium]|nr:class I SAM-dependent methyltransferase [Planctomycetales bacterium]
MSRQIYRELGPQGLASRTTTEWDDRTVAMLSELLRSTGARQILDVGCGYGRIAIPLVQQGYLVRGIDVSPRMMAACRENTLRVGVELDLELGDATSLPYGDSQFDAVLCLWLTFNELMLPHEQSAAMSEMVRVLRPGGWALLDGPPYLAGDSAPDELPPRNGPVDPATSAVGRRYAELAAEAGAERTELFVHDCPGRRRYFFRCWKPNSSEG